MHFYEVWVRSRHYRGDSPLTYQSTDNLVLGSLVTVPLQREEVLAIVTKIVPKPRFTCKAILKVHPLPPLPSTAIELLGWLSSYYPAPIGPLTQLFVPPALPKTRPDSPTQMRPKLKQPILNNDQAASVKQMKESGSYLLHGRTGSGKTRVYATLAKESLDAGRSVIILSPEISLSPQLAHNLEELLDTSVVVFHSRMTTKQRTETWVKILTTTVPLIVIGPRSVLFTPLSNIGLIVIDESHEPAYKQEQQPYYYAPRVAAKLSALHTAKLVLGSATPSVAEYYIAEQKGRPIIELNNLAVESPVKLEKIVVDLKDKSLFPTSAHISLPLIQAIRSGLSRGEQSLIYLNRRGTARISLCQVCSWQATCPNCDLPLTYHGDSHRLLCHTCGHHLAPISTCPVCGNADIVFKSAGTKAIVSEVEKLFPGARVMRFDTDNTRAESFDQYFSAVKAGDVDIIIGTQLLAKGLDLPSLTTLGIVMADSSLTIPDFTAQERTYQLVRQVLGRIGRGHKQHATAIIQTYNPDNPTLLAALDTDWRVFYESEIKERRQFMFPPFCYLLKLTCQRASAASAEKAGLKLKSNLEHTYRGIKIDGPAPAFHEKMSGHYQWQLVIKSKNRSILLDVVKNVPKSGWTYDIDPINLL